MTVFYSSSAAVLALMKDRRFTFPSKSDVTCSADGQSSMARAMI